MKSSDLVRLGFQIWRPFNLDGEKSLLACMPKYKGVYVIRSQMREDSASDSDVIYIGSVTNQSGLNVRIRRYFHPGYGNKTSLRIKSEIGASLPCCSS
jgi:hypothetical protein